MIIAIAAALLLVTNTFSLNLGFKDGQQRPNDPSFFHSEQK